IVSRMVICTGGGSNGNPRHAAGTPLQSYRAPTNGRRRKYACDRGASAATVTAKRRVARVPLGTGELMASSRSTLHPTGVPSSIPSSVTPASPAFHTLVSTWTRSPGITMPSSANPSITTPAAAASASSRIACCPESAAPRSEEHTSELQSPCNLVCRLLLEKKKKDDTDAPRDHQHRKRVD